MSILYEFTNSLKTEKAQFRWTDQSVQVLKAGTPLDANGAIANDATAVGIVAYDVPPSGRSMWSVVTNDGSYYADVELITSGYIDEAAAESSCGLEYTDALKGALSDIVFVDGEIGSGGGGQPTEKTERTVYIPEQTVSFTPDDGNGYFALEGVTLNAETGEPNSFTLEILMENGEPFYTKMIHAAGASAWESVDGPLMVMFVDSIGDGTWIFTMEGGGPDKLTISAYTENTTYSGASIPDYTAEDKGKVLTIGEVEVGERVIYVPEQSVSIVRGGSANIVGADFSKLPTTGTVPVKVNGRDVEGRIENGEIHFLSGGNSFTVTETEISPLSPSLTTIFTLSIMSPVTTKVVPVWGGGAFIVNSADLTADKTWAEIKSAYDDGKMVILHKSSSSLLTGDTWDNLPLIQLSTGKDESNNTIYRAVFITWTGSAQSPIGEKVYLATSTDGNLTTQ